MRHYIDGAAEIAGLLTDEAAAQQALADLRWPNGVRCPLCPGGKKVYELAYPKTARGKATVRRQWKCGACKRKFSVTSRSIFEGSHLRVGQWIYAISQICGSRKGISANRLARELDIGYRSARLLCRRVREAMKQEPLAGMIGQGPDAIVELDQSDYDRNRAQEADRKAGIITQTAIEGLFAIPAPEATNPARGRRAK
jgi:transposase-like protein